MKWLGGLILLASLVGLILLFPALQEFRNADRESFFSMPLAFKVVGFFLSLLVLAGYFGILFTRWLADFLVDLILDSNGTWSPPPPSEPSIDKPSPQKPASENHELHVEPDP